MAELNITSQTVSNTVALVKLAGELDSGNFDTLEDEFNKLLESGVQGIILDLSGLDAIASAGLGAIVYLSRVLATRRGKLVVASPRPKILGLLELLGLGETLTVTDSPEQARKLVSSIK